MAALEGDADDGLNLCPIPVMPSDRANPSNRMESQKARTLEIRPGNSTGYIFPRGA